MPSDRPLMFHELAPIYDATYESKDYRKECRVLRGIVRRYGRPGADRWLDVACGTGRHLEYLRRDFSVEGVDLSRDMLRLARRRLPGLRLTHGDMRNFDLGRRFDVVTCLFSAIGHLGNERDLERTFANFARHLRPGGVAIVEPWIDPAEFRPGHVHVVTHRGTTGTIVRLATSRRRGAHSLIHYHYLIAEPGRPARYLDEEDEGLMVSPDRLVAIMRRAGLQSRFLRPGLVARRGLLVGRQPMSPARKAPRGTPRG